MRMTISWQSVEAGDKLVSEMGREYFLVERNDAARAKDFRVISGQALIAGVSSQTAGGHRHNLVTVERHVASDSK